MLNTRIVHQGRSQDFQIGGIWKCRYSFIFPAVWADLAHLHCQIFSYKNYANQRKTCIYDMLNIYDSRFLSILKRPSTVLFDGHTADLR